MKNFHKIFLYQPLSYFHNNDNVNENPFLEMFINVLFSSDCNQTIIALWGKLNWKCKTFFLKTFYFTNKLKVFQFISKSLSFCHCLCSTLPIFQAHRLYNCHFCCLRKFHRSINFCCYHPCMYGHVSCFMRRFIAQLLLPLLSVPRAKCLEFYCKMKCNT